jgi:uncharacterized CHY-type Zn-finger protein
MSIPETKIHGSLIDNNTRCSHYNSELDIIAIKLKCCDKYYACINCHNEMEQHEAIVWQKNEFNEKAIICGSCKTELSINNYLICNNTCPNCKSSFNPKCKNHYPFYFEV